MQRQVAPTGEEPQTHLWQLPFEHVLPQAEPLEVLAAELDRGLADLVARIGQRPRETFHDDDRQLRHLAAQLTRQQEAREATAADRDVPDGPVSRETGCGMTVRW